MADTRRASSEFQGELAVPPRFYKQWMLAGNRAFFFDRLVQDFGDFVHYRGLFNFYLVNHPALVKQVLQETNTAFDKGSVIYDRFRKPFGDGLVVAEGEHWKRQRKLLQQVFGPVTVRRFLSSMVQSIEDMLEGWDGFASEDRVFNVATEMNHLTLAIAGRAFFHDSFAEHCDSIQRWTHTINYYSAKPPLPIIRSYWFPSRLNRRMRRTMREFHEFLQSMIEQRREDSSHDDLLSILVQARHEDGGAGMSDLQVREEVLGMIIGGHETASSALTWAWRALHLNPQVRSRLQAEADSVLGDGTPTIAQVSELQYTRMVVEETLRLHPPFWFENRNVRSEVSLGGVQLKPGDLVAFSRYSLHRHSGFWNDPERFDPMRFEPGKEENSRSTYASVPFGGGPRVCIGVHFAMLELVLILAMVSRRFQVEVDPSDRHELAANLTLEPRYGVQVHLSRR